MSHIISMGGRHMKHIIYFNFQLIFFFRDWETEILVHWHTINKIEKENIPTVSKPY